MCAERIRESVIAGTWYPGHPKTLRAEIVRYLDQAEPVKPKGDLVSLVVPHAGYMYSGGVAAYAYKQLEDTHFERVLILAPSHRAHFRGTSTYNLGGYKTPLGVVPLDQEIVDALLEHEPFFGYFPEAEDGEHSLEIQLPFLQVILKDFKLIPVIMGEQSLELCSKVAEVIGTLCRGKRVLLVASSDLSHFHSYREARELDQRVVERVRAFDPEGLSRELYQGTCEACGGGPIVTAMLAARNLGADTARVLHYANSGDVTGENSGVVGYMAAALYNVSGSTERVHDADG